MGQISRRLFGLSLDEVRYDVRGFRGGEEPSVRAHVERVGERFLDGFHAALEHDDDERLIDALEAVDHAYRGFAYEGAAMSLYLLDRMVPWRRRFDALLASEQGASHVYMAYVGAGWAMARLPFGLRSGLASMPPLMRWLALDGYGFHQSFFDWPKTVEGPRRIPARIRGYGRRAFDQGVGRSLWFVDGHDVDRITRTIAGFPADRRPDLWSGVGLASIYAGGVDRSAIESLLSAAGSYRPQLAQGVAFGAEARHRAGNVVDHNHLAAEVICDRSVAELAELTHKTRSGLDDLETVGPVPAFEVWRRRLQDVLRPSVEPAIELAAAV